MKQKDLKQIKVRKPVLTQDIINSPSLEGQDLSRERLAVSSQTHKKQFRNTLSKVNRQHGTTLKKLAE